MSEQPIIGIQIDTIPESQAGYDVGRGGVTRIEAYGEPGLHCDIPHVRVWRGDEKVAEFCKHQIVGVYYGPTERVAT